MQMHAIMLFVVSQAWQQYKHLNKIYGHKLRQFCDNSIIWVRRRVLKSCTLTNHCDPTCQIHGYELFLVPTFITMHAAQSKTPTAFFLPTPFPSSEVRLCCRLFACVSVHLRLDDRCHANVHAHACVRTSALTAVARRSSARYRRVSLCCGDC